MLVDIGLCCNNSEAKQDSKIDYAQHPHKNLYYWVPLKSQADRQTCNLRMAVETILSGRFNRIRQEYHYLWWRRLGVGCSGFCLRR